MKRLKDHHDAKKEAERFFKIAELERRRHGETQRWATFLARAEWCQKFFESQLELPLNLN